jgi:hypothetical protein
MTREHKAKLSKAERKAFRSQMWAFRRDPESLTPEERQALEVLFETIPKLKDLYRVRLRFQEIFDTARDRITAARWLRRLRRETIVPVSRILNRCNPHFQIHEYHVS